MKYTPLSDDELAIFAAEHDGDPRVTRLLQERRLLQDIAQRRLVRCTELEEANRALRGVVTLRWKRIGEHSLPMPQRAMVTEAGHDLPVIAEGAAVATGHSWACPDDTLTIFPGALVNFRSGWAVEIPPSHFGLVHVRSSVGKAQWVLASSGVIDPSYRGEIHIPLLYLGVEPYHVRTGERMAQMMIVPRPAVDDIEVDELSPSDRGEAGFGSTGR